MDQLTAMKVFVAVVEAESFAAAAEKLGQSRTMVSKHVMDLEAHLKARLLNRTTRSLSLTGSGRVYYERARRILSEITEADAEAMHQSLTPSGRLRVSAPVSFGISHVAPRLAGYLDRYGDVEVELVLNDRFVDLVEEGYDVAIRIGVLADSGLVARRMGASRMVACAAPAYLERRGTPRHPDELSEHACLSYSHTGAPERWRFAGKGAAITLRLRPRLVSNNGDALMAAAVAGLGIAVQPDFIVGEALADGRLTPILQDFDAGELGIHAVYPSAQLLSARVRSFIDHLSERLAGQT